LTLVNLATGDRIPRNTDLHENITFTNKMNAASFGAGKENR
jgi:hypothetical protein